MYKKFRHYIQNLSLVIGYLNLLNSFYCDNNKNNSKDADCIIVNQAMLKFKNLCKSIIKEVEKLIEHQQSEISLNNKDLIEIEKLLHSVFKPASQGRLQEIIEGLNDVNEFINFLINDFPSKNVDRVDLRDIKTEILLFKYQVYMS